MMPAELASWADPDIGRLEEELASLGEELARAQAELAEAQGLLAVFTRAHGQLMAPLYAELDEIEARIAEFCAADSGRPEDRRDAHSARARARESAAAADAAAGQPPPTPPPPPEAKPLYRTLAKRCHPDLAVDEADRKRREAFITQVNEAYEHGDIGLLNRLAAEWDARKRTAPDGPDQLARLRAAVKAARAGLTQVRAELAGLAQTRLGRLLLVEHQGDLQAALKRLDFLAGEVRVTIAERRQVLADLTREQR
jgi:hypothetical protein